MAQHRIQIFNPGPRKAKAKGKSPKRNPLSELIFMSNPGGKKKRKHKANPFPSQHHKSKSKKRRTQIFSRSHHRRNPSRGGGPEGIKGWAELGGGGLVALFGSNYIAEMAFGSTNSGIAGYLITGGIGLAIALLGGKFVGKKFATGATVGALLAVAYRAYQDYGNTPTGKVNQIAAKTGAAGNSDFSGGMGTYTNVAFPFPAAYQWGGGPGSGLTMAPGMPALNPAPAIAAATGYAPGATPIGALERDARY